MLIPDHNSVTQVEPVVCRGRPAGQWEALSVGLTVYVCFTWNCCLTPESLASALLLSLPASGHSAPVAQLRECLQSLPAEAWAALPVTKRPGEQFQREGH